MDIVQSYKNIKSYFNNLCDAFVTSNIQPVDLISKLIYLLKRLAFWDIDRALRYYPVVKFIQSKREYVTTVLEVGCGSMGKTLFFKKPCYRMRPKL